MLAVECRRNTGTPVGVLTRLFGLTLCIVFVQVAALSPSAAQMLEGAPNAEPRVRTDIPCPIGGNATTLRGVASRQSVGDRGTIWVLKTDRPFCLTLTPPVAPRQRAMLSLVEIGGQSPPAGVEIELKGTLFASPLSPGGLELPRLSVTSGKRVATTVADSEPKAINGTLAPTWTAPTRIDNVLAAALTDCDRQAKEQVERDDANWTIGPHLPRQFDQLWTQHVNEIEQQRQQCRRSVETATAQRAQEARNVERDRGQGYPRISVESFVLDGRELAAREAKVSLIGSYISDGSVGVLYVDARAIIMATYHPNAGGSNQPKVPLLTDGASRDFRQRLLACQTNPASAQVGCPVTALGHVTMCKLSNVFGARRDLPCLAVEDGR
jgi:hypothetical protein